MSIGVCLPEDGQDVRVRAVEAGQRLVTDDHPVGGVDDRLHDHGESGQRDGRCPEADSAVGHDPIAPGALRLVQGKIGAGDTARRLAAWIPEADTGGERLAVRGACPQRLDARLGLCQSVAGEKNRELFAAIAGEQRVRAELLAPVGDHLSEQAITRLVAVRVVVGLEVVQVQHGYAQVRLLLAADRAGS